jgi:hypothetical protein
MKSVESIRESILKDVGSGHSKLCQTFHSCSFSSSIHFPVDLLYAPLPFITSMHSLGHGAIIPHLLKGKIT